MTKYGRAKGDPGEGSFGEKRRERAAFVTSFYTSATTRTVHASLPSVTVGRVLVA